MSTTSDLLPITETLEPDDQAELARLVREAHDGDVAVYPLGGATSLDYGLPARRAGIGLSLTQLARVVDYPSRDMTITVEAGIRVGVVRELLAAERQQLALDVPRADQATLGGVVATNFNGYRRYGLGSIRDQVIGISAVDGRGIPFKGGGRVVKNVAGYDFCKLLTGSLGTLGVITQLTLKVRPIAEAATLLVATPGDLDQAETWLAALSCSATRPVGIELLVGESWRRDTELAELSNSGSLFLVLAFEGTEKELRWQADQVGRELKAAGATTVAELRSAERVRGRLVEFPQVGAPPLSLRASLVPSGVTRFVAATLEIDAQAQIQTHAGHGQVLVHCSKFPTSGLARTLVGRLQVAAASAHGHVTILANPGGGEMTRQAAWGGAEAPYDVMTAVKQQFDPKQILNPGRFVYLERHGHE